MFEIHGILAIELAKRRKPLGLLFLSPPPTTIACMQSLHHVAAISSCCTSSSSATRPVISGVAKIASHLSFPLLGHELLQPPSSISVIDRCMQGHHYISSIISFVTIPFHASFEVRSSRYELSKLSLSIKYYYFMCNYLLNYEINYVLMKFT